MIIGRPRSALNVIKKGIYELRLGLAKYIFI